MSRRMGLRVPEGHIQFNKNVRGADQRNRSQRGGGGGETRRKERGRENERTQENISINASHKGLFKVTKTELAKP